MTANISDCYSKHKFSFGDALNTAKSTAMQCINDKVDQGKAIIRSAIDDIKTAAEDVADNARLMAQCSQFEVSSVSTLVAKISCLSQVSCGWILFDFKNDTKLHIFNSRES